MHEAELTGQLQSAERNNAALAAELRVAEEKQATLQEAHQDSGMLRSLLAWFRDDLDPESYLTSLFRFIF